MTNIVQIVGYKNSGKTTLMKRLIQHFSAESIKVGTLKHHGHGGDIDLPKNSDSTICMEAGSCVSGVQGESISQLIFQNIPFEKLIKLYTTLPIELLLIEGYKNADYPKIILVKSMEELSLLDELSNIIAVGSFDVSLLQDNRYPTFDLSKMDLHMAELATYIINK